MKKRAYDSALREGLPGEVIDRLWREWQESEKLLTDESNGENQNYKVSGFEHPNLYAITGAGAFEAVRPKWGLIPSWVKDESQAREIKNKTLNARGESIFEKAAFKLAAQNNRCLIFVDGFFEHYHYKGRTYPYFIQSKSQNAPLVFGGLWAEWINKNTGEIITTASIITTIANELMAKIHNNPKANGPRMPLILDPENFETWLFSKEKTIIKNLIKPFSQEKLTAFTVGKINGKDAVPNGPDSVKEKVYPELFTKELFD